MEIHRVDSLFPVRPTHGGLPADPAADAAPTRADKVEISPTARLRDRLRGVPDVRADKIAALRKAIADGTYETEDRFVGALDRLLDDLRPS